MDTQQIINAITQAKSFVDSMSVGMDLALKQLNGTLDPQLAALETANKTIEEKNNLIAEKDEQIATLETRLSDLQTEDQEE